MHTVDLSGNGVNMDKDKGGSGGSNLEAARIIVGGTLKQVAFEVAVNALAFSNPVTAACQGIKFAVKLVKFAAIAGIGTCAHPANSQNRCPRCADQYIAPPLCTFKQTSTTT